MNLNSINRNSIDRNSTSINKTSILALFLVSVFVVSGVAGVLGIVPIAHASPPVCTTTYSPSSPGIGQQWTIGASGTYCLNAGTYDTQITITASNVVLTGTPGTTTASLVIIKPSTVTNTAPVLTPAIIYVGSGLTGVTVEGLTVDGSGAASYVAGTFGPNSATCELVWPNDGCYFGIAFYGASGTIQNNVVTNMNILPGTYVANTVTVAFGEGIYVGTPSGPISVTISGNTVSKYAENGIVCRVAGTTCTISGNAVSPLTAADASEVPNGIEMAFGATGSITGNTVSGNACGAPLIASDYCSSDLVNTVQATGILTYGASGPITISGNTLASNDVGTFLQSDTGAITVTSNTISSSIYVGVAVYDESQIVSLSTFSSTPVGIEAASDTSGLTATATVSGNTFSSSVITPFLTEAAPGGTAIINSAGCVVTYIPSSPPAQQQTILNPGAYCFEPGTYDTQITIAAGGVTLKGAPGTAASQVIIRPGIVTDNSPTPSPADFAPAIIYVGAGLTGVTVEGLTVDGSLAGSSVPSNIGNCVWNPIVGHGNFGCWFGISYWGASGTITGNVVTNINNGASSPYADTPGWGEGIHVGTPSGSISVTISGNTVSNYAENGITCSDTGMTCTISGNTVSPLAAAEVGVISNGIELAFGAMGSITGNKVSGNVCTATAVQTTLWNDIEYSPYPASNSPCGPSPYQFSSTGILTSLSIGAAISGNTLTTNDVGIYLSGDTGPVTVTGNNVISHSTYDGILVSGESASVSVSGNRISSTLCSAWLAAQDIGQPGCGPDLVNDYQADGIATSWNTGPIAISSNTLSSNNVGIFLSGDAGTVTVASNTISGSSSAYVGVAVYDESQTVSSNAFSSMQVGIEAVSDTSGITATVTVSGNTFSSISNTPYLTETANGGIAQIVDATPGTSITCGSSNIPLGSTATCDVVVTGNSPTGTVSWSQTGPGSVSFSSAKCTLSSGQCEITVTGESLGPVSLTAAFLGDLNNDPSSGTSSITVTLPPASVTVFCNPASVVVGRVTICKAIVLGSPTPTGKVTWSTSGSGKFPHPTCKLHNGVCSEEYITTGTTATTITASYLGDKHNSASSGTFSLTVTQATSKVVITCSQNSMKVGRQIECRARVTGYESTGTVTWAMIGGSGTFSFTNGNTCSLTNRRCLVTMTAATAGEVVIQAAYSGDSNNSPSYSTHNLNIKP